MRISDWSSDVCSSDLIAALETPFGSEPARDGEMAEGHHRLQPEGMRVFENAAVAIELGQREAAGLWFDARPFDAEAVAVEPETRRNPEILPPAIVTVAGVARRFAVTGRRALLTNPGVRSYFVRLPL